MQQNVKRKHHPFKADDYEPRILISLPVPILVKYQQSNMHLTTAEKRSNRLEEKYWAQRYDTV
jgi:hypothetical protein